MNNTLLILVIFLGCNQITQKSETNVSEQHDSVKTGALDFSPPTTALPVRPLKLLPASFRLDSVILEDTSVSHSIRLYLPVSNYNKDLNKLINSHLEYYTTRSISNKIKDNFQYLEFSMWLTSFQITKDLINFCFTDQSFYNGAAHFNHSYSTLNYDIRKRKKIMFRDLFMFFSKKDKQTFCNVFNEFNAASDGLLNPKDLTTDLDYQVTNDRLILYFDDYEKGPSLTSMGINLAEI